MAQLSEKPNGRSILVPSIATSGAAFESTNASRAALVTSHPVDQLGEMPDTPQTSRLEEDSVNTRQALLSRVTRSLQNELSPFSLWYHLKECMLDFEIQEQKLVELKDLARAISWLTW